MTDPQTIPDAVPMSWRIARWAFLGLAAVLYTLTTINAIGNFLGMRAFANNLGEGLSVFGWVALLSAIALPALVALLGVWITRRQPSITWLALLTGVGVVAMAQLEMVHLIPPTAYIG